MRNRYGDVSVTASSIETAFTTEGSSAVGTGIDPEGIDNNPAYYTLVLDAAWSKSSKTTHGQQQDANGSTGNNTARGQQQGVAGSSSSKTAHGQQQGVAGSSGSKTAHGQHHGVNGSEGNATTVPTHDQPQGVDVAGFMENWSWQRCGHKAESASKAWAALLTTVYKNSGAQIYEHHMKYCPSTARQSQIKNQNGLQQSLDSRCGLLSDPSTDRCREPSQNTSTIQQTEV